MIETCRDDWRKVWLLENSLRREKIQRHFIEPIVFDELQNSRIVSSMTPEVLTILLVSYCETFPNFDVWAHHEPTPLAPISIVKTNTNSVLLSSPIEYIEQLCPGSTSGPSDVPAP